jgi:hypothetical protein
MTNTTLEEPKKLTLEEIEDSARQVNGMYPFTYTLQPILLWLDDVRYPPTEKWTWVKTAAQAIEVLKTRRVRFASLDHDLAPEHYPWHPSYDGRESAKTSGQAVTRFLLEQVFLGDRSCLPVDGIRVHSMNTFGSSGMIKDVQYCYGRDFQMETKYEVLPWQLSGQHNGWYMNAASPSMWERYKGCSHSLGLN